MNENALSDNLNNSVETSKFRENSYPRRNNNLNKKI